MLKNKIYLLIAIVFLSVAFFKVTFAETILTDVITDTFKYDLYKGSKSEDVPKLQKVLNLDGSTVVSCSGVGASGNETDYFGPATEAAVIKFQKKYNISPANGYVGIETRDVLNKIYRCYFISGYCTETYEMETIVSSCEAKTVVAAPVKQESGLDICKLVELLISIDAINPEKVSQARGVAAQNSPSGSCGAYVDLKANGSDKAISISSGNAVTLTWTSFGVSSCAIGTQTQNATGTQVVYPYKTGKFTITCKTGNGEVSDSAQINIPNSGVMPDSDWINGLAYSMASSTPSYNFASRMTSTTTDVCTIYKSDSGLLDTPIKWTASSSLMDRYKLTDISTEWSGNFSTTSTSTTSTTTPATTTINTSSDISITHATTTAIANGNMRITFSCSLLSAEDEGSDWFVGTMTVPIPCVLNPGRFYTFIVGNLNMMAIWDITKNPLPPYGLLSLAARVSKKEVECKPFGKARVITSVFYK